MNTSIGEEPLTGDLLEKFVNRLRGEILDELGDLIQKFMQFLIQPGEKVCVGLTGSTEILKR